MRECRFPKIVNGIFIVIYMTFSSYFLHSIALGSVKLLLSCSYLFWNVLRKPDPDKRDFSATCSKLCNGVIDDITVVIKISFETIRYVDYDSVVTFNNAIIFKLSKRRGNNIQFTLKVS